MNCSKSFQLAHIKCSNCDEKCDYWGSITFAVGKEMNLRLLNKHVIPRNIKKLNKISQYLLSN